MDGVGTIVDLLWLVETMSQECDSRICAKSESKLISKASSGVSGEPVLRGQLDRNAETVRIHLIEYPSSC